MTPRSIYIIAILLCMGTAAVNSIWFGLELRRFVNQTRMLSNENDMNNYKTVVAHQMYAALVLILLLVPPPVIYFLGLRADELSGADILFVIVPAALIILLAVYFKRYESLAKTMPVGTQELLEERDAVVHTWQRKPLPNW